MTTKIKWNWSHIRYRFHYSSTCLSMLADVTDAPNLTQKRLEKETCVMCKLGGVPAGGKVECNNIGADVSE